MIFLDGHLVGGHLVSDLELAEALHVPCNPAGCNS